MIPAYECYLLLRGERERHTRSIYLEMHTLRVVPSQRHMLRFFLADLLEKALDELPEIPERSLPALLEYSHVDDLWNAEKQAAAAAEEPAAAGEAGESKEQKRSKNKRCPHGNRRQNCRSCVDTNLRCIHDRIKYVCIQCKGSQTCEHGKIRYRCSTCKGSQICVHGRVKQACVACKGKQVCPHGKNRYTCVPCKGPGICIHGKRRYQCVQCGGSGVCLHQRRRDLCRTCKRTGRGGVRWE